MSKIMNIFSRLQSITEKDGQSEFVAAVNFVKEECHNKPMEDDTSAYQLLQTFLSKIFLAIDELSSEILNDDSILISVKNQKILRTCFQLVTSIGISNCLIPGLGISLTKRCSNSTVLHKLNFKDEEKYKLLVDCTNFFTRCFKVPVIKNIIVTLHLSDYLAALIQLSFAPLRKPGVYSQFVMTQEMHDQLNEERKQFVLVYTHLVSNCFQPALMKELLVLQGVTEPPLPAFAKRAIAKEMSQRLVAPGGLLSLIRCFIESHNIDTGLEWKKIDLISRLVSAKHGIVSENDYLTNIASQLSQILFMNNTQYLTVAIACVLRLKENYPNSSQINNLVKDSFQAFDCNSLRLKSNLPGTVILSPLEVNHKVNILHACICSAKLDWPVSLLSSNMYVLFMIGSKCSKHRDLELKLNDILPKCLGKLSTKEVGEFISNILFVNKNSPSSGILIEEYDSGIAIKTGFPTEAKSGSKELTYLITLFKAANENSFVKVAFEASLDMLIHLNIKRENTLSKDLLALEDEPVVLSVIDEEYATILQLLSEVSTSPKVIAALKNDPTIVMNFLEHFLSRENLNYNEECLPVALVLLVTVLSSGNMNVNQAKKFATLSPILKKMSTDKSNFNYILCKQALALMTSDMPEQSESACGSAISNVFDDLLPVRAHGIMELTKLIDAKDPETISKKQYIFCLFQEQLKDPDSYIYLSVINGLAALSILCTEDVLHILCKEFLQVSPENTEANREQKAAETRMKIGDVIVRVTKRLGEMAIVHKSVLLNTMLCACRDDDPLIRTSALSNLAEIALVLHYKIGNIIYELLLCICGVIETDKAVECRRAAVMVISSLLKGLGKDTLVQLKDNLLPIYRTLKHIHRDDSEDSVVRLHAQIALEELNNIVNEFMFPEVKMEKRIFILDKPEELFK